MPNLACQANGTLDACKKTCAANADCGGFLYYSKTGEFALKNRTCWDDIGPLPESDYGDDLFVMHPSPQPDPKGKSGALVAVTVCIASASERLGISTDESYVLDVPSDAQATATVSAPTVFGAMHALESLTQIVDVRAQGVQTIPSAPVHIEDAPQYPFRGLMIDSGRHFLPVAHVKHVIAAAAMVKLNVIHWHLTDAQSFATCSHLFPALCAQGAYPNNFSAGAGHSPSRNVSRATYSLDELRDIVSFAKGRGVRIQPEWDMPGHGAWGMGMPQLVTSECAEALDVTRPELYQFLLAFLHEMGTVFEDEFLFLGGDELDTSCFDDSPSIAAWMKAHGLNASSTQQYFWQQMTAKVFPHLNRTISVWRADDPNRGPNVDNMPRGTVFNVYQSLRTGWESTVPQGIPTVVSIAGNGWYLDGECGGYNQNAWNCVYNLKNGVNGSWLGNPDWTPAQKALFLGGETAMWGEGINEDNFDAFVWRGAAAAAERLWSSEQSLGCPASSCPGITGARKQTYWLGQGDPRFADQLCRMSRAGVKTGPTAPGFCPSDAGSDRQLQKRLYQLETENARLRAEVSRLRDL